MKQFANLKKLFTPNIDPTMVKSKKRSMNEIIEEIHETFYTEVD